MTKNIDFEIVANLITELREKVGLNQIDFAKEIGVSKGAVCQWEQGSGIKTEHLYDIAKYFNITVTELIEGKLNDEDDSDYFSRNYDIDGFKSFDEINVYNYSNLLEYLKRCKNLIKRFMSLFKIRLDDDLTRKQEIEYRRLSKYFAIDWEYIRVSDFPHVSCIDDAAQEYLDFQEIETTEELDRIMYKFFFLNININPLSLLEYENDDTALNEYLELIGKERCDVLLTKIISDTNEKDIEKSLPIRRLIERGARCLFTRDRVQKYEYNEINEDVFDQLAEVSIDENAQNIYELFANAKKNFIGFKDDFDPYNWKNYEKDDYEILVDKERTNSLRDIVMLKDADPEIYYKNLKEYKNL